jgi:peptide/nickel transport system permease protein
MKKEKKAPKTSRSQLGEIWHRLKKNKSAMISLVFIILLVLAVVFSEWLTPYQYDAIDLRSALQYPSLAHPLGTDQYGRDLLTRLLVGGRVSLLIALITVVGSVFVAGVIGVTAGYFGGWVDNILMRCMDVLMAIPGMLLAITIASALGSGIVNTAIAIGIGHVAGLARIFRSSVLLLREQEYVEAAEAFGSSHLRIIIKHILPNTLAPVIVQCTLKIGESIISIAGLSFIGLGIAPPTPEWGSILNSGRDLIMSFWPIITFPGLLIALTTLAFNLLGDGLRDAMDPRLKQ